MLLHNINSLQVLFKVKLNSCTSNFDEFLFLQLFYKFDTKIIEYVDTYINTICRYILLLYIISMFN